MKQKEKMLQDLWATALGIKPELIGIEDRFFQLGRESIAAIKLAAAARRMDIQLTVANIFWKPVFSDMIEVTRMKPEANTLQYIARVGSNMDLSRYRAEWEQIVAENPIFRTRIVSMEGVVVLQVVIDEKIGWKSADSSES